MMTAVCLHVVIVTSQIQNIENSYYMRYQSPTGKRVWFLINQAIDFHFSQFISEDKKSPLSKSFQQLMYIVGQQMALQGLQIWPVLVCFALDGKFVSINYSEPLSWNKKGSGIKIPTNGASNAKILIKSCLSSNSLVDEAHLRTFRCDPLQTS